MGGDGPFPPWATAPELIMNTTILSGDRLPVRYGRGKWSLAALMVLVVILLGSCASPPATVAPRTRAEAIPPGAIKVVPTLDTLPPRLHSDEYEVPVPLDSAVNTAGGEDSAFVMPDGNTLYFFFTPDVSIPAEKQLLDGVTGIYVSREQNGRWQPATRVVLQSENKLALDGCAFVQGDTMWFGSAREGNYRGVDIWTARLKDGRWTDWQNAGEQLNLAYEVGELHITADGNEMYFHSPRSGGQGEYDIWVTNRADGEWQLPQNVGVVNTTGTEGWPFVTQDGNELWFTRTYQGSPAIFRSKRANGQWQPPELVISQFAGEPSLDNAGNIYFTHHFFKDGRMIEADIYVAYRK